MFEYSFQIDCCQHIDQMSEAFGFSAVQGPKDMMDSRGPTCPNCPHGRALTSLRTAELVRNWEVAWLQDNKSITSRPTLQKWPALQLNKSMNFWVSIDSPLRLYVDCSGAEEWRNLKWFQKGPTRFWCLCVECHYGLWARMVAATTVGRDLLQRCARAYQSASCTWLSRPWHEAERRKSSLLLIRRASVSSQYGFFHQPSKHP